jgi:diguanylate cyclase (GGDEF)-like protein
VARNAGKRRRTLAAWIAWALGSTASFLVLGSGPSYGISAAIGLAAAGVLHLTNKQAEQMDLRRDLAERCRPESPVTSHQSPPDALTGFFNRPTFERALRAAIASGIPLSLVMFDLDHLEAVNRELGREGGDSALRRFAGLMQEQGRDTDLFGRLGGDELAAALIDCDEAGAWAYAERVGRLLQTRSGDDRLPLSVSAGVATHDRGQDPLELLIQAEHALHAAKDAGRARTAVWRPDPLLGEPEHGLVA